MAFIAFLLHQRKLQQNAMLMQEAIRNKDFNFRLRTSRLFFGERTLQETMNELFESTHQQLNLNEVESWKQLTRVLTHEMMNATAPITSISQSMMYRDDVKDTPLENGIRAIYESSSQINEFVANYRKMTELDNPVLTKVAVLPFIDSISKNYSELTWEIDIAPNLEVQADSGILRQVIINLVKNAIEADSRKIIIEAFILDKGSNCISLYIGNDGKPIPEENIQSLFVPLFTTKRNGCGIGLSLSRMLMRQQGGDLRITEKLRHRCNAAFEMLIGL